jgi:hypothetical protein
VSSATSCVVIKTDHASRRTPAVGKLVKMEGKTGLFVVIDIDRKDNVAQLMEKSGKHRLMNVPFSLITPVNRNLGNTIRSFLDAREEAKRRRHR